MSRLCIYYLHSAKMKTLHFYNWIHYACNKKKKQYLSIKEVELKLCVRVLNFISWGVSL